MTPDQIRDMIAEGRELVPGHLWPGLERYFVERIELGDFLQALLCNDLRGTFARGDETSTAALPALCRFLYNYAPAHSHGSSDVVDTWLTAPMPT